MRSSIALGSPPRGSRSMGSPARRRNSLLVMGAVLGLLAVTLVGCGDDDNTGAAAACDYYDVDDCTVFGLVLADPLPLADALASVSDLPGVPVALWRTDAVCISQGSRTSSTTGVTPGTWPLASWSHSSNCAGWMDCMADSRCVMGAQNWKREGSEKFRKRGATVSQGCVVPKAASPVRVMKVARITGS